MASKAIARPRTIQELAQMATIDSYDPSRSLKDSLRAADALRQRGNQALTENDLETAFVNMARAGTIIVEKIPKHPDYLKLRADQRQNLASNGNQLLNTLGNIKLKLHERHEKWLASGGEEMARRAEQEASARAQREVAARERAERIEREAAERRDYEEEQRREEYDRKERLRLDEEERTRIRDDDLYRRRDAEERERAYRSRVDRERQRSEMDPVEIAKEKVRAAKQRQAEEYQRSARRRGSEIRVDRRTREDEVFAHVHAAAGITRRSPSPAPSAANRDPPEREREVDRPPMPSGPRPQPRPGTIDYPSVPASAPPESISYVTPKKKDIDFSLGPLPLESPTHAQYREPMDDGYESSTSYRNGVGRRPSYPVPITTTSPGRNQQPIQYPKLMTAHQKQQGYIPSSNPMFASAPPQLLGPETQSYYGGQSTSRSPPYYGNLPSPTSPTSGDPYGNPYPYPSLPVQSTAPYSYPRLQRTPSIPAIKYASPPRSSPLAHSLPTPSVPALPPKVPITPPQQDMPPVRTRSFSPDAGSPPTSRSPPGPGGLRQVWLPQETLTKFLSIAAINTARKKETCGLLLGKMKNDVYTVYTLLVPRQTSDENSCTMTNEEMVIDFQEKRELLTLGWIHTHPTQSCFMSSLDLHTHCGFQSMLPEAFAIVCAPKSTPSFGIFRLTDPPGLQIISECNDKNAFHPHPDRPIYTDADSGHVKMADLPLEIADLRPRL